MMSPVIGLVAQDETRSALIHELGRYQIDVAPVSFDPEGVDAVLFENADLVSEGEQDLSLFVSGNARSGRKMCALLSRSGERTPEPDGMTLTPSLSAFAQQLRLFLRRSDILAESELRQSTLNSLQSQIRIAKSPEPLDQTILYFGEPGSFYLRMKAAMSDRGYKVSAVLSERTAFEAFRSFVPSAFVVCVSEGFFPFELLDHVHGRTDLKSMPVIAVSPLDDRLPDNLDNIHGLVRLGQDFQKSVRAIEWHIDKANTPEPVAPKECTSPARDKYSGCFSDAFAEAHIKAQVGQARTRNRPLCVAKLEPIGLETRDTVSADQLPLFGSILGSVLRKQDALARLSWSDFLVSLPATNSRDAAEALERARRVLEMTEAGSAGPLSFRYSLLEYSSHLSPDQFWHRVETLDHARRRQASVA